MYNPVRDKAKVVAIFGYLSQTSTKPDIMQYRREHMADFDIAMAVITGVDPIKGLEQDISKAHEDIASFYDIAPEIISTPIKFREWLLND